MTTPNIVCSIMAQPKAGKTHFALTWPAPILVQSFDIGTKFVADKFPDKQIDIIEYPTALIVDIEGIVQECQDVYQKVAKDFNEAVDNEKYKTIVLDTGTALWEIVRAAFDEEQSEAGKRDAPGQLKYVQPNRRMAAFFAKAQIGGMNLVVTSHVKEKYAGGVATGEMMLDGFKKTEAYSDICLSIEMKGQKTKAHTVATILDTRYGRDLRGETIIDVTYNDILALLGIEGDED